MSVLKRTTGILLSGLMVFGCMSIMTTAASAVESGDYSYNVIEGEAEITGYSGKEKEVVIPEEIDGYKVTSIGEWALSEKTMEKVEIPNGVKTIGESAFAECKNLSEVKLPESLEQIVGGAFYYTAVKQINLPDGIKKIYDNPFVSCENLTSINVSDNNENFSTKNGVLYNKKQNKIIAYPNGKTDSSFTVGKKIKTIGMSAFSGAKLNKITFKKGVKTIGDWAFSQTSIKKLSLPASLKTIGKAAFHECKKLKSVYIPTSVKSIGWGAFMDDKALTKINFKGSSKLVMENAVFTGCYALKKVSVPQTKSCRGAMFSGCKNLKSVKISSKIKKIYSADFMGCVKLKSITVPKTVKKIGWRALGYNYEDEEAVYKTKLVIKGYKNSAAHKYAKKNYVKFKKIG